MLNCSSENGKSNEHSEAENDDDDDVSQILLPNGNQQKQKNEFANEYDESCYKLQLSSIP